ncbi:mitochondrial enolase superfamily member 1 [Grus japonensis]|uniref:Mitochondrial enolase superfamily member 1 n=1 Tax=Grus japonensis TaxID=30415 RepID=A0ABC9XJB6_GRUJA
MDEDGPRAAEEEPESGRAKTFIRLNDLSGAGGRPGPGDREAGSGDSEAEALPYPALAPVVFFYLSQESRPRSWCLRLVCNPYPLQVLGGECPELEDRDGEQSEAPTIQGEKLGDLLHHLDTHRSMGLDGIHPRVLRELVEVLTKPLSITYQQSWLTGEVPVDWRLANVMPIYKKGWKEDLGNYRPVSLTLVLGKVMEQIILSAITWHIQDNQVIRPSQHWFMKGRSCLTNLISFWDKVAHLGDEGKAVDVIYLDSSKAFDTISYIILLEKPVAHGLGERTLRWLKNRLDGRAQRVVVNGVEPSWHPVTSGVFPRAQCWGQFSLISLSMTWTRGSRAPSGRVLTVDLEVTGDADWLGIQQKQEPKRTPRPKRQAGIRP